MSTKEKAAEREETALAPAALAPANVVTSESIPTVKRRIVRNLQKYSSDAPLSVHGVFYVPLEVAIGIVSEGLTFED